MIESRNGRLLPPSTKIPVQADDAEVKRRRKQTACVKEIGEIRKAICSLADRAARLEELFTTGQSSVVALELEFIRRWELRTGETYLRNPAVDRGILRVLMKKTSTEDLRARMALYFERSEDFVKRARWSLAVFEHIINSLGSSDPSGPKAVNDLLERAGFYGQD